MSAILTLTSLFIPDDCRRSLLLDAAGLDRELAAGDQGGVKLKVAGSRSGPIALAWFGYFLSLRTNGFHSELSFIRTWSGQSSLWFDLIDSPAWRTLAGSLGAHTGIIAAMMVDDRPDENWGSDIVRVSIEGFSLHPFDVDLASTTIVLATEAARVWQKLNGRVTNSRIADYSGAIRSFEEQATVVLRTSSRVQASERLFSDFAREGSEILERSAVTVIRVFEGSLVTELMMASPFVAAFVAMMTHLWHRIGYLKMSKKAFGKYMENNDLSCLQQSREAMKLYKEASAVEIFGPKTLKLLQSAMLSKHADLKELDISPRSGRQY